MALQFLNDGYFAGKVGIGATAASKMLEVTGDAKIEGTLTVETSSNNIRLLDSNDSTVNFSVGVNAKFQIRDVDAVTNPFQIEKGAASNSLYIDEDGKVGIGTASPDYPLTFAASLGNKVNFYQGQNWGIGLQNNLVQFINNSSAGDWTFGYGTTSSLTRLVTIEGTGNVGIGTSAPVTTLHVDGGSLTNNVAAYIGGGFVGNDDYHKEGGLLVVSGTNATQTGAGIAFQTRNTQDTNYWKSSVIMDRDGAMRFTLGGAGTVAGSEDFTILSNGNVGIGIQTPTSKLHINQSVTNPDLDQPSSFAVEIDSNHSGSAATTGDREQGGLYIDVDSSTTGGDTSNEHRLYGIYNKVNHSGDSDLVYGTLSQIEQNTTAGTTSSLIAVNATAISDGGANASLTNITGSYGAALLQDATPIGNSWAGKFMNNSISDRTGTTVNAYGISSEIQIDSTSSITNLFAGRFLIDSNANYTATNSYLLYLEYAGTSLATNVYSIYSPSDVKSYHEGSFGIGTESPDFKLDVDGTFGVSDLPFNTDSVSVLVADETIGAELVTNGDFATDTNWTKQNSGSTISGGKLNQASVPTGQNVFQITSIVIGNTYKITFTISNYSAGGIRILVGSTGTTATKSSNGTFTVIGVAAGNTTVYIQAIGTTTLSVDNVSVKQITSASNQIQKKELSSDIFPDGPFLPLAGGTMTGTNGVVFPDNFKLNLGTNSDLQIYHDGSNSYIDEVDTGDLFIRSTNGDGVYIYAGGTGSSNKRVFANSTGSVDLYYGSTKRLETTNTGISVTGDIVIDSALLSNQENTDIDTGAEVVAQVAHATYTAAFFDFVVKKGTNVRSGTVYACHDGTNVEFTETSTQDLGDTSDVVLSVDISGANMRLMATVASDDWSVKSLVKAI